MRLSHGISGFKGSGPCPRWERSVFLSVSGDLPRRSARALDRHLLHCAACRQAAAEAKIARDACLRAGGKRTAAIDTVGIWEGIQGAIDGRPRVDVDLPATRWSRPRPILVPALLIGAAAAAVILLLPLISDRTGAPDAGARTPVDAQWEEFVSGSERAEQFMGPFAPAVPNPEVIEF